MKPYDGIEVWMYFVFALLAISAIVSLVLAYRIEKVEKAEEDPIIASGIRGKKYLAFGGFAISAILLTILGFMAQNISQENYQKDIVSHVESHDVNLVEGFVDPSLPLLPNTQAKFVIESDAGLLRCRANAADANEDVSFVCQNAKDKERDFTIPLSEVNDAENIPAEK